MLGIGDGGGDGGGVDVSILRADVCFVVVCCSDHIK